MQHLNSLCTVWLQVSADLIFNDSVFSHAVYLCFINSHKQAEIFPLTRIYWLALLVAETYREVGLHSNITYVKVMFEDLHISGFISSTPVNPPENIYSIFNSHLSFPSFQGSRSPSRRIAYQM